MLYLAVYYLLLIRLTGQQDIVIGAPIAGREHAAFYDVIGFFVNTLALRSRIPGNVPFRDLFECVRTTTLEAFEHQSIPFEKVVESLAPFRDLSYHPVFQVAFSFKDVGWMSQMAGEIQIDDLELPMLTRSASKFDITLSIEAMRAAATVTIEYATDIFEGATIERFAEYYQTLLQAVLSDPTVPIFSIPLTQGAQLTGKQAPILPRKTVHECFLLQASLTPDRIAISCEDEFITYAELDSRSNRCSRSLAARGVGPESVVGIHMHRSIDLIVAMLAVLKAGGAYLALDPDYPADRLNYMLEDSQAKVVITSAAGTLQLPSACDAIEFTALCTDQAAGSGYPLEPRVTSSNMVCLFYTSGSTGKPKAAMIDHAGMLNLLWGDYCDWRHSRPMLQLTSTSFDPSTFEVWWPLVHGGRCITLRERILSPDSLKRTLATAKGSIAILTSALFNALADEDVKCFDGIKQLSVGGEPPSGFHCRAVEQANPTLEILNAYGPVESNLMMLFGPLSALQNSERIVPLTQVLSGVDVYIVGRFGELVPDCAVGELCISGRSLARGYLDRPGLTASRFMASPFGTGERLYRTGDRARKTADGRIQILGRIDRQVKVRGQRIELGEVEFHIRTIPGIDDVHVMLQADVAGDKALVAFVIAPGLAAEAIRASLAQKLPAFMVPAHIVSVPSFPLTPNGKIDAAALPRPTLQRATEKTPPRNASEKILCGIFEEVLLRERVGVFENFFELGGHSLSAMRVVSRAKSRLFVDVSVRTLFEHPTVAALSSQIEGQAVRKQLPKLERAAHAAQAPASIL